MKLKKELGLLEVFSISAGAMISSGLFILPALAYAKTGPSVIIAYAIASVLVIPTLISKAELATAMPKAGGNYFFIDRSMGPRMGALGGLADWFSLWFKSAFSLLGIGIILTLFNPGVTDLQIKLLAVVCCIFFTLINLIGVKVVGKFQVVMVIILLSLLTFYIIIGSFFIQFDRYSPFMPLGLGSVFATAGFVFISYAGLTKIIGVAEEVKNPGRNIPLGMFLAWIIISLFYFLVLFITIGVTDATQLQSSLMPVSTGAGTFMGWNGSMIMGLAALLAFATTANAGLLAASRTPLAMSKDELLPNPLKKISKRGTPTYSILFTAFFMIIVILFLNLENLVKAASTMILLLFIFINLAVIFMRESNLRHYRPKYKAPLYPYIQIIGIIGYGFLIFQMGSVPLLITGIFLVCGLAWYYIYAYGKIKREYAFLHVVERIMGEKTTDHLLDEELREILIDRDNITEARFEMKLSNAMVLDLDYFVPPDEFAHKVAEPISKRLNVEEDEVFSWLIHREKDSNIIVRKGFALISFHIQGRKKFEIALVRTKRGAMFSEEFAPVNAAFILVSSADEENFYLHSLMWLVELCEMIDFKEQWLNAKSKDEIREIVHDSWKMCISDDFDLKSLEIEEVETNSKKPKKEKSENNGK
jgi:amino acid transporter/mannitol/fructose-specific phosphotransferase system IIA component (Ntr-type)